MTTAYKVPKLPGTCVDHLFKFRTERLALQKKVDDLKARETLLKNHLIDILPKSNAQGITGKMGTVKVITKKEPIIKDREVFRKYINRTKHFELAQALKPSAAAIKELWEDGKKIPGVDSFNVVTLSMTKR